VAGDLEDDDDNDFEKSSRGLIEVISQYFLIRTEKKHENPHSG
jgi:hypothetical protein